jgi:hypothetical protein
MCNDLLYYSFLWSSMHHKHIANMLGVNAFWGAGLKHNFLILFWNCFMSILTWQYASLTDLLIWWCCDSYQKLPSPTILQLRYLQHRVGWQMSFIGIHNCLQLWAAHTASSGLDCFFGAYHMLIVYGTNPCAFWRWVFCCLSMKNALELLNHGMQMSWLGLNVSLYCVRIVFMRRSNRIAWCWIERDNSLVVCGPVGYEVHALELPTKFW